MNQPEPADQSGATGFMPQAHPPAKLRSALKFFTIMAIIVGCGLLLLTVELILRYGFHNQALDWWPPPHGFLFILYVIATANLGTKAGWSMRTMILVMLAGCVPFLSFYAEKLMRQQVEGQLARLT